MKICGHREANYQDLAELHEKDLRYYYFNLIKKNLLIVQIIMIILMQ